VERHARVGEAGQNRGQLVGGGRRVER
jgi:hypothetical protein